MALFGWQKSHTPVKKTALYDWNINECMKKTHYLYLYLWCRKLAKSTFLLVSLFGLQYVLFAFFPDRVSALTFKIWNVVELALASTQVMMYKSTSLSLIHIHTHCQAQCIYIMLFIIHIVSEQKIIVIFYNIFMPCICI